MSLDREILAEKASAVERYEGLDMNLVFRAAREGPADLRVFLAAIRDALRP